MGLLTCCFGGSNDSPGKQPEQPRSSPAADNGPANASTGQGSKRTLSRVESIALKALLTNSIISSQDDAFKTDFSDGSMPALHSQARKGNFEAVKQLLTLDREKKMCKIVYGSRTPLHQAAAAKSGRIKTVRLLLDHDVSQIGIKTKDGRTALHIASESDDDEMAVVKMLIDRGGRPLLKERRFGEGSTCLHMACALGRVGMVQVILQEDPSVLDVLDENGRTCVHVACAKGQLEVLKVLLLQEHADLTLKDKKGGYSPLHLASIGGYPDICRLLLSKDEALIGETDTMGRTCFQMCCENGKTPGHWQVAQVLLEVEPALLQESGQSSGGMTSLHYAASFGQMLGVNMLLPLMPSLVEAKSKDGDTVLHLAAKNGHADILSTLLLVAKDAELRECRNAQGFTCLHVAVHSGQLDATKTLMEQHKRLMDIRDAKDRSVLIIAACVKSPNTKLVKMLLDARPDLLFATDPDGKTPLHHAADAAVSEALVRLLAEAGGAALILTKDKGGRNALAVAAPSAGVILENVLEKERGEGEAAKRNV
jgi:ankyrin repeat protein